MASAQLTPRKFARKTLKRLGISRSDSAVQSLVGWERAEGGHFHNDATYNPLNTTLPKPGAGNTGTQGNIKQYRSLKQGVNATAETLALPAYKGVVSALKGGSPQDVAKAVDASPWGTHGALLYQTIAAGPKHAGVAGGGTTGRPRAAAAGTGAYRGAKSSRTTSTTVDPQARSMALLDYVENRDDPDALLGLASTLRTLPRTKTTVIQHGVTRNPNGTMRLHAAAAPTGMSPHALKQRTGTLDFEGTQVAAWIKPVLKYAREHGWKGSVSSGFRSFADQTRIYNSGVRPAAVPGTSNHEGSEFPRGAVDVSDAQHLSSILLKSPYAHLLQYAGAKDTVHFSHPHDGSY